MNRKTTGQSEPKSEETTYEKWNNKGVKFIPSESGNGGRIENSYLITNHSDMREYVETLLNEYESCFDGSVAGIVYEWEIHNIAHVAAVKLGATNRAKQAMHVDVGRTIYDDSHKLAGLLMKGSYRIIFPYASRQDLFRHYFCK